MKIAKYFDDAKLVGDNREYVTYTGYLMVKGISNFHWYWWSQCSITLEELVNVGLRPLLELVPVVVQLDIKGGDVVIAIKRIRQEGTTKEYAPIEFPAVADLI